MCCMLWIFSEQQWIHQRIDSRIGSWVLWRHSVDVQWWESSENRFHGWASKHRKTLSVQTLDMFQWSTLCWMNGNVSCVFLLLLVLMSFIHAGLTQGTVLYCSIFDLLNKCELCCSLFVYMNHMRIPHLSLCWWFMSIFCCHSPSPRIICLCSSSWC